MKISKAELGKLNTMLTAYVGKHGTIATNDNATLNDACGASCTHSCSSYCDGSRCMCWKTWKGNG